MVTSPSVVWTTQALRPLHRPEPETTRHPIKKKPLHLAVKRQSGNRAIGVSPTTFPHKLLQRSSFASQALQPNFSPAVDGRPPACCMT